MKQVEDQEKRHNLKTEPAHTLNRKERHGKDNRGYTSRRQCQYRDHFPQEMYNLFDYTATHGPSDMLDSARPCEGLPHLLPGTWAIRSEKILG